MNDQIEMIDRVLGELQKNVAQRAVVFFRFGWVIFAGCISHYLLLLLGKEEWLRVVWIAVPIVCISQGILSGILTQRHTSISHSEKLLGGVWGVAGLVMIYISLIAPRLGLMPKELGLPMVLLILFFPIILTGIAIKHTPTIVLSSLFFFGSIAVSALDLNYHLHILTLVILFGLILPSHLIRVTFR